MTALNLRFTLSALFICIGAVAKAEDGEHLGTVVFPVSCSATVSSDFNRGVALLHDFWYAEARPQFERILKADPDCAMAHWGLALSGFHQIWDRPDDTGLSNGWREVQAAQATPAKTPREREYIAALGNFFRPGQADYRARINAYAAAMAKLYQHYPQDVDAGAFYSLSLLAQKSTEDGSLTNEHKAMTVLAPLWKRYPDHPGLVHYIIHACDTPSMAADGLAAARHYGEIAYSGPHAVHMPGHIYARLGMWEEDIQANRASVEASQFAEAHHESGWMDQFHSDDFLLYAYLQSGQDAQARDVVKQAEAAIVHYGTMPDMASDRLMFMFPNSRTKLPVFLALETRDWEAAAALEPIKDAPPLTKTQTYWAHAIADGHLRRSADAQAALLAYQTLMKQVNGGDQAYLAANSGARIRRQEITAWVAFAQGNTPEALTQMRVGADLEDKVGQGEVDIPAREMLADMLLESGKPSEALSEYKQSMKLSPNRFNALFNAGQAAEKAGNVSEARGFYVALLKSTDNGSRSARAEIKHAKSFVSSAGLTTH